MAKKQTQTNVKKRARYNSKYPRGDKQGGRIATHKGKNIHGVEEVIRTGKDTLIVHSLARKQIVLVD